MLNSLNEANVGIRDQGTLDFDVFDQRMRALLNKLEETFQDLQRCDCPRSSSLQVRFLRPSISTPQMIDQQAQAVVSSSRHHPCGLRHKSWQVFVAGFAVLLSASGLALCSRNFACQLSETFSHCHILQTRYHLGRRAPEHRSLTRILSQRTPGVWRERPKSSNLDSFQRSL